MYWDLFWDWAYGVSWCNISTTLSWKEYISVVVHLAYKYCEGQVINSVWIFYIIICSTHCCLLAPVLRQLLKRSLRIPTLIRNLHNSFFTSRRFCFLYFELIFKVNTHLNLLCPLGERTLYLFFFEMPDLIPDSTPCRIIFDITAATLDFLCTWLIQ